MKATELRIGNWVNGPHGVAEITSLNRASGWAEYWEYMEDVSRAFDFEIQMINPIPITEEWLERFGFGRVFGMMCYGNIEVEKYSDKPGIWEVWFDDGKIPIAQIKYVHQLQNIYFTLNREELEIKPEK